MKNKMIKFGIISCAAMMAVGTAVAVTSSGLKNTRLADNTTYTIALNDANSPASESVSCPSTYKIETELGSEITFSYTNCTGDSSNHAIIGEDGVIKNIDAIHGIESFVVSGNGSLQYRSSNDGTSWSSYTAITSGETTDVAENTNYIEFSTSSGTSSFNAEITYSCEVGEEGTKYNPANYYDGYYSEIVSWTDGEDLKEQLHTVISRDKNSLSYDDANWDSNIDADHVEGNYLQVDAVYTNTDIPSSVTKDGWQREHAWCASLMTGSKTSDAVKYLGRATDFHNLFAGEAAGNMSRGNKNFGIAGEGSGTVTVRDNYSFDHDNFEPGDNDKGRVARAIFYMATMYTEDDYDTYNKVTMKGLEVVDEYVNYVAGDSCAFQIGNKQALLAWNNNTPVDRLEMQHNVSVQTHEHKGVAQNNRNPYVDYPGLVDYVFGSKQDQAGKLEDIKPSAVDLGYSNDNKDEHRNYVVTSAQEKYTVGNTFTKDSVTIGEVLKDFTVVPYSGEWSASLEGHTFTANDGKSISNTITFGDESTSYDISIEGMTTCTLYHEMKFSGSGITAGLVKELGTNAYTWNDIEFTVSISGDGTKLGGSNRTAGGCTIGSGSAGSQLTKLTIETIDAFSIDQIYVSGCPGNASSGFTVTAYVGATKVLNSVLPYNSAKQPIIYGGSVDSTLTGTIKIEFTGSSALIFEAFAFNVVE